MAACIDLALVTKFRVFTLAGAHANGRITVDIDDIASEDYCHEVPYRMAFSYLVIYWIFFFFSCCSPCWMGLTGCGWKKRDCNAVNEIPTRHEVVVSLPSVSKGVEDQEPPKYNELNF